MLTFTAPNPLDSGLLAQQLADAGLSTTVAVSGTTLRLDITDTDRAKAQQVIDAHPATAQAAADTNASQRTNEATIRDRATQALSTNTTFLAITSPTNAQVAAQVKALTRQNQGLIRLLLGRFDGTD